MAKTVREMIVEAEAPGAVANPCRSIEDALNLIRDEPWGGVFVTKEVYDRFDWRNHLEMAKSDSHTVIHGMNDSEDLANVKIVDKATMSEWEGGNGPDAGWRVYAWRIEWTHASMRQVAWILHMAEEGWKHFIGDVQFVRGPEKGE